MSGNEVRSDGTTGTFHTYSNDYICTNNIEPKCPPGYCLDVDCQTCTDIYTKINMRDMKKDIKSMVSSSSSLNKKLISSGIYYIFNVNSGKSLDCSQTSSSSIIQYTYNGNLNQQFYLNKLDDEYYTIKCMNNDKYFDIESSSTLNGAKLLQSSSYNGEYNQQFKLNLIDCDNDDVIKHVIIFVKNEFCEIIKL